MIRYKGDIWVANGNDGSTNVLDSNSGMSSVEKFSLQSLTWTGGPSLPVATIGGQLVEYAGRFLFVGGENNKDIYEMQNNAWVDVGDLSDMKGWFIALKWDNDHC